MVRGNSHEKAYQLFPAEGKRFNFIRPYFMSTSQAIKFVIKSVIPSAKSEWKLKQKATDF